MCQEVRDWQAEDERASFAGYSLQPQPGSVQLNKLSRQCQAKPGALLCVRNSLISLLEGLEDARLMFRCHA